MQTAHDILADLIMKKAHAHFAALWPNGDVETMAREGNHEIWMVTIVFRPAAGYSIAATYEFAIGSDEEPMIFYRVGPNGSQGNSPDWPIKFTVELTDEEWATVDIPL